MQNRYLHCKKDKLFYIFVIKFGHNEFYTTISEDEAKRYKINPKKAEYCIGCSDSVKKLKNEYQERVNSDTAKKQKAYYQYLRAAKKEATLRGKLMELQKQEEENTNGLQ